MIENVVGPRLPMLPGGNHHDFTVNSLDYLSIPMATEGRVVPRLLMSSYGPSTGSLNVSTTAPVMIAQIQLVDVFRTLRPRDSQSCSRRRYPRRS